MSGMGGLCNRLEKHHQVISCHCAAAVIDDFLLGEGNGLISGMPVYGQVEIRDLQRGITSVFVSNMYDNRYISTQKVQVRQGRITVILLGTILPCSSGR